MGGRSSERAVSLRSGRAVNEALNSAGYKTVLIDPRNLRMAEKKIRRIDVAFLALHGHGGEDGTIQRWLSKKGIPFVGSDALSSLRAFDKVKSKKIFRKQRIPTAPFTVLTSANWKRRLAHFRPPCFAKPACDGSSVGVFCIEDFSKKAVTLIKQGIKKHGRLLIERKITGRELTVGILGESALPVIELVPKRSFYDYRAKYTKGMTEYLVPAPVSKKLSARLQQLAMRVHRGLGLRDLSRVDIMVDRRGRPYVLEANSLPGMTNLSLIPKAARAAGISFEDVCQNLVTWALQRSGRIKNGKEEKKKIR